MTKSTADSAEKDVREAAVALADRIEAARRAGLHVAMPTSIDGLRGIAISAGARAGTEVPATSMEPVAVEGRIERFEQVPQDAAETSAERVDTGKGAKA